MTTSYQSGLAAIKALMQEFDAVDDYLKAVREVVQTGHMPDITGLDDRISRLCTTVQGVEPDIQKRCMVKLDELMKKLNNCEEEMSALHESMLKSAEK